MNLSKSKLSDFIFLLLIGTLIAIFSALLIFSEPKPFSEKENRALNEAPTLTYRSFFSGDFSKKLSLFCTDQFPLREYLTDVKAKCEIALGKRENNGIFLSNEVLVDLTEPKDTQTLKSNIEAINDFAESTDISDKTTLICAPRSKDVNASSLGFNFSFSQYTLYSELKNVDINSVKLLAPLRDAQKTSEDAWYSTDHHWTTHGAYIAYSELFKAWEMPAYSKDLFDIKTASRAFLGTTYSKSGITDYTSDNICLYRFEGDENFNVEYVEDNKTVQGFYDLSKLTQKDKYGVFLGGNFSEIKIRKKTKSDDRPRLLLIKDSFANSVIPFLALHFDIDVIDPRYFGSSLSEKIKNTDYDKILILCGIDTLATDESFGKTFIK